MDCIEKELDCRRVTLELMEHDRDPVLARIVGIERNHPERGVEEDEDEMAEREDLLEFLKGGRQNRNSSGYSRALRRRVDNYAKKKLQSIFATKTTGL